MNVLSEQKKSKVLIIRIFIFTNINMLFCVNQPFTIYCKNCGERQSPHVSNNAG